MRQPPIGKRILGLTVIAILLGVFLFFSNTTPKDEAALPPREAKGPQAAPPRKPASPAEAMVTGEPSEHLVLDRASFPSLPPEKVEEYLVRYERNAPSLLAAFHALNDTNYLNEAAARFPDDPQVQWTVLLSSNSSPEERRRWLDLFKASSPENSLPNYLSAAHYFKTGQPERAVAELLEAADKTQFKNYLLEARLNEEALLRAAGRTSLESLHGAGWVAEIQPDLARFKALARDVAATRQSYLDAGDFASANELAQTPLTLANRLRTGESGKLIANQLSGHAIEAMTLDQLDQNTPYEFLDGKTPAERSADLKTENAAVRELIKNFWAAYATLNESELTVFEDRVKIYGEAEAVRRLVQWSGTNIFGPSP